MRCESTASATETPTISTCFTDRLDAERFAGAVGRLVTAYQAHGLRTELVRHAPSFARLVVTGAGGETAKADLGVDHRQYPPVDREIGPVLSEPDAVGSKVGALYSRLEPRDLMDLQAILDSGRYNPDTVLALATGVRPPHWTDRSSPGNSAPAAGFRLPASLGTAPRRT
jgi:hypothetical protein